MEAAKKNQDFGDILRACIEVKGMSNKDFAELTGLKANTLSNYLNNVSRPNFETLVEFTKILGVSSDYLLGLDTIPTNGHPNGHLNGHPNPKEKTKRTNFETPATRTEIIVATQDTSDNATFTVINYKAAANFLSGYQSQEYFEHLGAVTLPRQLVGGTRQGLFYQIQGDSMETKFKHGDWVACTLLERGEWGKIADSDCYVVVSRSYGIQFKRIKNRLREGGFIRCYSDNRTHAPFTIDQEDLLLLYHFVLHVSADANNPNEDLYKKLEWIEDTTSDLREMYEEMKRRLDNLDQRSDQAEKRLQKH